jgi:hypothetical protein
LPWQNRVTPFGDIEVSRARGLLMGNRGILHSEDGTLRNSRWRHKSWIACLTEFKGRKARINAPGHYTQLFFLDEAVSLAAGHRPCAECRRQDFLRFADAYRQGSGGVPARIPHVRKIDEALHEARVTRDRRQIRITARVDDLPDGAFVIIKDRPDAAWLIWHRSLHRWSHEGYSECRPVTSVDRVRVLTPAPSLRVLAAGYRPGVHPSAVKGSGRNLAR